MCYLSLDFFIPLQNIATTIGQLALILDRNKVTFHYILAEELEMYAITIA